jgi:hypothetical protein
MYRVSSAVAALKRGCKDRLLLAVILLLGAWVRLSALELGWFLRIRSEMGWQPLACSEAGTFRSLARRPLSAPSISLARCTIIYCIYWRFPMGECQPGGRHRLRKRAQPMLHLPHVPPGDRDVRTARRADRLGALRCFPDGCPEWEGALEPGVHPIFSTLFLWTLWRLLVAR